MEKTDNRVALDLEWVSLVLQAKRLGLKAEEVRLFLEEEQKEK